MRMSIRSRFVLECMMSGVSAALAALAWVWPDWIERAFAIEPDGGDGSVEWGIVAAFGVLAIVSGVLARVDLRRLRSAH